MATQDTTSTHVYPSLDAFDRSKGKPGAPRVEDPLAKYARAFGLWFTGAVRDTAPKPLPVLVEITEEVHAVALAKKGGRPLEDADASPRLVAMLRDHYAGKDPKDWPPGLVAFLTPAPAPVAFAASAKK